jgi:ferrous iron transport protein B
VGGGFLGSTLLWGLDGGILAALGVAIPYILTFYVLLAVLEDSGYLNAAAFLTDRIMHRFCLHGRAAIPLIAAAGCNVPAIMGTRVLTTMRERIIASVLITFTPCSARTAVILGSVSLYAGWQWALFVYAVILVVGLTAGVLLNKMLPGEPTGLIMEVFPLRRPQPRLVIRKTWFRFREFLRAAAPIIVIGSLVLGGVYESGLVWHLTRPLSPIIQGWLGLPAVAGLTLLFAVLRKELALQLLVAFALVAYGASAHNLLSFMTPHQLVVYAIVNSLYVPCVATIAMLGREFGWRRAALISASTVAVAVLVGGLVSHGLALV